MFPLKEYLSILASPQAYDSNSHTWTSLYSDIMVNGTSVGVVLSAGPCVEIPVAVLCVVNGGLIGL